MNMNLKSALTIVFGVSAFGAVLAVSLPSVVAHIRNSQDPACFTDDARQHVAPYAVGRHAEARAVDYVGAYYKACHPIGFKALYGAVSRLTDPRPFSKMLPYALLAMLAFFMMWGVWKTTGWSGAVFVLAIVVTSDMLFSRLAGGLPRSFGFPLFAMILASVLNGNIWFLAIATVLSAAFYPALSVSAGMALAAILFLMPRESRGQAGEWTVWKRFRICALSALLTATVVLPTVVASSRYGMQFTEKNRQDYAEAGEGGRFISNDRMDYSGSLTHGYYESLSSSIVGKGRPFWPAFRERLDRSNEKGGRSWQEALSAVLLALVCVGVICHVVRAPPVRRGLVLVLSVLLAYGLSLGVKPWLFLPQRHLAYSLPLLAIAGISIGLSGTGAVLWRICARKRESWRPVALSCFVLVAGGLLLAVAGDRLNPMTGLMRLQPWEEPIVRSVRELSPGSLVAGWPDMLDTVPYMTGCPVLLSRETHLPYHKNYTDEMRRRFRDVIAAMYAQDAGPVLALRERYGVTHLLVSLDALEKDPPEYFAPFRKEIAAAFNRTASSPKFLQGICASLEPLDPARRIYLVDLRRIGR
jgi:hypothetical protein